MAPTLRPVPLDAETAASNLFHMRQGAPLVHCITNSVVQEVTANVLLAAGASPAMVMAEEEVASFAARADALLINVGTIDRRLVDVMRLAIESARHAGLPWVLDPVAAGVLTWRDQVIRGLLELRPTVIRGNASEIRALAGQGQGGKGVDATETSDSAIEAAVSLSRSVGAVVCVTGATDYVTNGKRLLSVSGGHPQARLVVGTGCSLSALVAAFLARSSHPLSATASACALAKRAAEQAAGLSTGPGGFRAAYIDALQLLQAKDFY